MLNFEFLEKDLGVLLKIDQALCMKGLKFFYWK